MTAVTEKHGPGRCPIAVSDAVPIDLTGISDAVDGALAITLCVPDRQEIDLTASRLRGALNLFLVEDFGFGTDSDTRQMYRDAHRLLELNTRPTTDDSSFIAYEFHRCLPRAAPSRPAMTDGMPEKAPLPVRKPGESLRRLRASGREPLAPDGSSAERSVTTASAVDAVPVDAPHRPGFLRRRRPDMSPVRQCGRGSPACGR